MYKNYLFLSFLFLFQIFSCAQEKIDSIQKINEVIIESQRLAMPFSKASHSISVISSAEIRKTTATTLEEIVQQVVGVDIRTKGIEGMQADLYIRGGNFNQSLLLIDGVKMDDLQTGHHLLNGSINIENIERIEVIKGAASRIYGQNAMNGAINIISKKILHDKTKIKLNYGSFENYAAFVSYQKQFSEGNVYFQVQKQQAEGYRYNTDFNNFNTFFKGKWKNYNLLASFGQRKFGANGFYANPKYVDQYEETQTNLLAIKGKYLFTNLKIKPTIYWRQNQDLFLLVRDNPSIYRNKHISNKIGISIDGSLSHLFGKMGFGLEVNKGFLTSNNLGNRQRVTANFFIEHQFILANDKLDLTPGIALAKYSDFGFFSYPGFNVGYQISNNYKLYTDIGYTSRIPTYTNLYYNSVIEQGNPDLNPENALTYEIGIKMNKEKTHISLALFKRDSTDLIDWVKNQDSDIWQAKNIADVQTKGLEFESNYVFNFNSYEQYFKLGYTFMDEIVQDSQYQLSRYTLNSYRHQFVTSLSTKFFPFLNETINYSYSERIDGVTYHLVDMSFNTRVKKWSLGLKVNNILNTFYSETNLVPMPGFNFMWEVAYVF